MRSRLALLLGCSRWRRAGAARASLLRERARPPARWPKSPPAPPLAAPRSPAHWDVPGA